MSGKLHPHLYCATCRSQATRRAVLGGVLATLFSGPAMAQFGGFPFSGGGGDRKGFNLDLGSIFDTLTGLFKDLGEDDELQIGETLYPKHVERSGGLYGNERVQDAMREFAGPIFGTSARSRFTWEITVTNENAVNAWALPGGKLAINKGLLRHVADPSELAAVIAHEMGHAELSHGLKMLQSKKFTDGLGELGKQALAQEMGGGMMGTMLSEKAMETLEEPMYKLVTSGYSRDLEREADQYIMTVFARTGHDPKKAANPYRVLMEVTPKDTDIVTSLFSSHPDAQERIAAIEAAAAKMPAPAGTPPEPGFKEIKQSFPTRRRAG